MKKFFTLLLILISLGAFAQEKGATTDDEYTYLTKGLKEQIKNGLDWQKSGYHFEKFFEAEDHRVDGQKLVFFRFINEENITKAIVVTVKTNKGNWGWTTICIPTKNKKLFDKFCLSLDNGFLREIMMAMSEHLAAE